MSDLPKSTNFEIGALCLDIPTQFRGHNTKFFLTASQVI